MVVPYKKDPLHSNIDWEKFFAIQNIDNINSYEQRIVPNKNNTKIKTKTIRKSSYKGGRKK